MPKTLDIYGTSSDVVALLSDCVMVSMLWHRLILMGYARACTLTFWRVVSHHHFTDENTKIVQNKIAYESKADHP